jgi:hypothetical protein
MTIKCVYHPYTHFAAFTKCLSTEKTVISQAEQMFIVDREASPWTEKCKTAFTHGNEITRSLARFPKAMLLWRNKTNS